MCFFLVSIMLLRCLIWCIVICGVRITPHLHVVLFIFLLFWMIIWDQSGFVYFCEKGKWKIFRKISWVWYWLNFIKLSKWLRVIMGSNLFILKITSLKNEFYTKHLWSELLNKMVEWNVNIVTSFMWHEHCVSKQIYQNNWSVF